MNVIIKGGKTLKFENSFSLLDFLEEADQEIAYGCKAGYCGTCKIKLLKGKCINIQEQLIPNIDNEILSCCVIPKSDIIIDVNNFLGY